MCKRGFSFLNWYVQTKQQLRYVCTRYHLLKKINHGVLLFSKNMFVFCNITRQTLSLAQNVTNSSMFTLYENPLSPKHCNWQHVISCIIRQYIRLCTKHWYLQNKSNIQLEFLQQPYSTWYCVHTHIHVHLLSGIVKKKTLLRVHMYDFGIL